MTFSCFASMTGPTSHSHSFKAIKRHSRLHQCNSLAKEMRFRGETAIKARLLESFALFPPQNLKRNYQNYQTLNPCLRQPFSFWNLEQLQSKQDKTIRCRQKRNFNAVQYLCISWQCFHRKVQFS